MSEAKPVTPSEARALIADGSVQVVDVRTASNFAGGYISGALNLPFSSLAMRGKHEMAADKPLIFVDANGARGRDACAAAAALGFEDTSFMEGGMEAWIAAGYEMADFDSLSAVP